MPRSRFGWPSLYPFIGGAPGALPGRSRGWHILWLRLSMHLLIQIFRFMAGFALLAAIACTGSDKEDKDVYETMGPYNARENVEKHDSADSAPGTATVTADSLMKIINKPQ